MSRDTSAGLDGAIDSYLLLEDGSVFSGKRFGADISVDGEIGKREHVLLLRVVAVCVHVHPVFPMPAFLNRKAWHMMAL